MFLGEINLQDQLVPLKSCDNVFHFENLLSLDSPLKSLPALSSLSTIVPHVPGTSLGPHSERAPANGVVTQR